MTVVEKAMKRSWMLFGMALMFLTGCKKSAEPPGGMGETGTSAIVPAIANAVGVSLAQ